MYRIGIDLGSSFTKGVLVRNRSEVVDYFVTRTGFDFAKAARKVIDHFSAQQAIEFPVYTCGYGREKLDAEAVSNSEIIALAKAVFELYQKPCTVIDIGGQDTKFIKIDELGQVEKFKMNRKCAAGTGSFLEEIAFRLDISPLEFNEFAQQATEEIRINSFCTVFAVSEIVGKISNGSNMPGIVLGIYNSIIERSFEMAVVEDFLVLTGGIPDNHPMIVSLFQKRNPNCVSPEKSQFLAAIGCVLLQNSSI